MSYFPPYIDASGVHLPTYEDRLAALVSSYQRIFGPDVNLEISSPDYQLLSLFARALDDQTQLILADFNARNPQYACGAALDLLMPLYGLSRAGATCSTAIVQLTGSPNAVLPSAPEALDDAGYRWRCQVSGIHLDASGAASVQAVCVTPGAISAPAGSIRRLVAPVAGLASMVSTADAVPGVDAESDASCRNRMRLAAAAPAVSTLEALRSAVLGVKGVASCAVYENDTESADSRGIPAHSICIVVSGGANSLLGPVIFAKKTPGIGTYGATSISVQDAWGQPHTVKIQRAESVPVALTIELRPLDGFDASVTNRIKTAMKDYGASLQIGQDLVVPSLYGRCYAQDQGETPTFSISLLSASAQGSSTGGILTAGWKQRYSIPETLIQVIVAS